MTPRQTRVRPRPTDVRQEDRDGARMRRPIDRWSDFDAREHLGFADDDAITGRWRSALADGPARADGGRVMLATLLILAALAALVLVTVAGLAPRRPDRRLSLDTLEEWRRQRDARRGL